VLSLDGEEGGWTGGPMVTVGWIVEMAKWGFFSSLKAQTAFSAACLLAGYSTCPGVSLPSALLASATLIALTAKSASVNT